MQGLWGQGVGSEGLRDEGTSASQQGGLLAGSDRRFLAQDDRQNYTALGGEFIAFPCLQYKETWGTIFVRMEEVREEQIFRLPC